jgi:diaminohydroxyphosphoribosylaminopyrimidine deaminase / 5-amino-6-(5-phosphoribosylamino)uracil reductase
LYSTPLFSTQDAHYMAQAIRLAERGQLTVRPNPAVGCVIVKANQVVGEGWHQRAGTPHAEVHALRMAGDKAQGATAYVTLEPCSHHGRTPPCCDALTAAGVKRVVVAMQDPNPLVAGSGIDRLRAAGIQVDVGLMETSARGLNVGFLSRMERALPFVRIKVGASLDGKTALLNGQSHWITSEAARADVQQLRARSGAIVTGIGTLLSDNPSLNVRLAGFETFQPLRAILDTQLRCPLGAQLFRLSGEVIIFTSAQALAQQADKVNALTQQGVRLLPVALDELGRLALVDVMKCLAVEYSVNDVLIEAGANLTASAINSGVVDELWWYTSGAMMGEARSALAGLPIFSSMQQVLRWRLLEQRQVGEDVRLRWLPPVSRIS